MRLVIAPASSVRIPNEPRNPPPGRSSLSFKNSRSTRPPSSSETDVSKATPCVKVSREPCARRRVPAKASFWRSRIGRASLANASSSSSSTRWRSFLETSNAGKRVLRRARINARFSRSSDVHRVRSSPFLLEERKKSSSSPINVSASTPVSSVLPNTRDDTEAA